MATFACKQTELRTLEEKVKPEQRWEILRGAVLNHPREMTYGKKSASIRNFEGYSLFKKKFIISPLIDHWNSSSSTDIDYKPGKWYSFTPAHEKYSRMNLKVKLLTGAVSKQELIGFDNTGNICIWPAEEVLAYLIAKLSEELKGLSVCELGGGMTGFAGLTAAVTKQPKFVLLSDGNEMSVDNCRVILTGNSGHFGDACVVCDKVVWGEYDSFAKYNGQFDLVIAADCLFFDTLHTELINTICDLLKKEGKAILLAPRRGKTLEKFCELASRQCKVVIEERYDDVVWERHLTMTDQYPISYIKDLHYPVLVKLYV